MLSLITIAHDGAGNELGKQGNVSGERQQPPLYRRVPAVNVDHVAHGLENIKRDANGKRDLRYGQDSRSGDQGVKTADQKTRILKKSQNQKICRKSEDQRQFRALSALSALCDQNAKEIVQGDHRDHQKQIGRFSPAIKQQAEKQQHRVLQSPRDKGIQQKNTGQKDK